MSRIEMIETLYNAGQRADFLMRHGFIPKSLKTYKAIDKVNMIVAPGRPLHKEQVFFNLINLYRADIIELIPPACTKYKKHRQKLIDILAEAEERGKESLKISDMLVGSV